MTSEKPKVKKIVIVSYGGGSDYSNIQIKEEDYPKTKNPNDVIVRIKAAGLNFAELMQRQGIYQPKSKTSYTPGYEASGVIEEVAQGVTEFKKGDRVLVFDNFNIWKEVVCVSKTNVINIPNEMSFEDAAALMVNYVTAYNILFDFGNLRPGSKVLIHMAAGGVGFAATQLCKTVDNVTVFGTASPGKHSKIKENGVDHPIDYTTKDYAEEVKKISPEGVDIVMDPLNGEDAIKGFHLLKPLGTIIHYGAASIATENSSIFKGLKAWLKSLRVNSLEILSENKAVSGYHLGILIATPAYYEKLAHDLSSLIKLYQKRQIKITIDSKFPYSKVGEAMHRIHSRLNVGKIILIPDSEFFQESA